MDISRIPVDASKLSDLYYSINNVLSLNELRESNLFEVQHFISILGCNCILTTLYQISVVYQQIYLYGRSLNPFEQKKIFQNAVKNLDIKVSLTKELISISFCFSQCPQCFKLWVGIAAFLIPASPQGLSVFKREQYTIFEISQLDFAMAQCYGILGGITFAFLCHFHINNNLILLKFGSIPEHNLIEFLTRNIVTNYYKHLESLSENSTVIHLSNEFKISRTILKPLSSLVNAFQQACITRGFSNEVVGPGTVPLASITGNFIEVALQYKPWAEVPGDSSHLEDISDDETPEDMLLTIEPFNESKI